MIFRNGLEELQSKNFVRRAIREVEAPTETYLIS
jgi:hypothetical protein